MGPIMPLGQGGVRRLGRVSDCLMRVFIWDDEKVLDVTTVGIAAWQCECD